MTREEAIKELRELEYYGRPFDNSKEQGEKAIRKAQALAMAIQILEQEPCEDAISRQAAKNAICDYVCGKGVRCVEHHVCRMKKMVSELPPVTSKPKMGRWINGNPICPCCGQNKFKDLDADIWADWQPKFCPNCGAKMAQESEEV